MGRLSVFRGSVVNGTKTSGKVSGSSVATGFIINTGDAEIQVSVYVSYSEGVVNIIPIQAALPAGERFDFPELFLMNEDKITIVSTGSVDYYFNIESKG